MSVVRLTEQKEKSISLRKAGKSYSEILKEVKVAKSTLSLWLRSVDLSKQQRQRLTEKRLAACRRGARSRHEKMLLETREIVSKARKEIGAISQRDLWIVGIVLYWAEGSKEKISHPGSGVTLSNQDPDVIRLFVLFLKRICKISVSDIQYEIYIHQNAQMRIEQAIDYWREVIGEKGAMPFRVYYKKHKIRTNRQNVGETYYGMLRVRVKQSSRLLRRITGWAYGLRDYIAGSSNRQDMGL